MRTLLLAAAFAAAATGARAENATPYQPSAVSRAHQGYSETQIDANRLRVSFSGNADTSRETVETYVLFRAAETTLQRGFDYFVVVDHNVDTTTAYEPYGPPLPPIAPRRYREVSRHQAVSEILMYRGARPNAPNAYDARVVHANLGWRVTRPN
jgi:hypothetical protein